MGVEDANQITDAQMTASSIYSDYNPYKGRLNGETGWCQGTSTISNDYIQVDMGEVRTVCAVATQGKKGGSYVTSYKLSLSTDGVSWNTYQEGNTDKVLKHEGRRVLFMHSSLQRSCLNKTVDKDKQFSYPHRRSDYKTTLFCSSNELSFSELVNEFTYNASTHIRLKLWPLV